MNDDDRVGTDRANDAMELLVGANTVTVVNRRGLGFFEESRQS